MLLTTNIMAKGIDIDNVTLVINVGVPRKNTKVNESQIDPVTYMHRIARTGRYIRSGVSLTYMLNPTSRFDIKDNELNKELKKLENLNNNEIKDISKIGDDYIKKIAKAQEEAL